MAKIILGQPPKEFTRALSFLQVDGTPGALVAKFSYRTRKQLAQFNDDLIAQAREIAAADLSELEALSKKGAPVPDQTNLYQLSREMQANVDYVMGCLIGWDIDVPLDRKAVEQLADEVPAAIKAIVAAYTDAIVEGRQGN